MTIPEDIKFEDIRNKMVDDLTPQEIDVIVANKDSLNEEEKSAFDYILQQADPLADNPDQALDNAITEAVDEQPATPEVTLPEPPATPAQPVPPATPTVPQTQEQLDAYLDQKRKAWDEEGKSKADQKEEEEQIKTFFDAGYKPNDWNEYTNEMFKKIAPLIEQRVIKTLEDRNTKFQEEQKKLQTTQQTAYKQYEAEFDTLSNNGLIPKRDDPEYPNVKQQIVDLGVANGKRNITDAYKLWSIIPVDKGGGLVLEGQVRSDPKAALQRQKEAAGRIQPARGGMGAKKNVTPSYNDVHTTNFDDALDKAKEKYGLA